MRFDEATFLYVPYHTLRKPNCESLIRQQENQIMLQDGEIDHRQHTGFHSDSLHMNVKKDSTVGEKADIDTFVITEGNVAQTALWTVYEGV